MRKVYRYKTMSGRNYVIVPLLLVFAILLLFMIINKDKVGTTLMSQPSQFVRQISGRLQPTVVSGYIIPSEEKIKNMSVTDQILTAHKYSDHIDVLCRQQIRIGSTFDGGKHICVDESIKPKFKECLVYSFGSRNEFSFESNAIKHFGCEVHTFDPLSMNEFSFETDAIKHFGCEVHTFDPFSGGSRKPQGCTFHSIGLGGKDEMRSGKKFQTLSSIMKDLKHSKRVIDILKVDVEESEWEFFENVLNGNVLTDNVKQIAIEIHFPGKNQPLERYLNLLRRLHQSGFLTFSRERNTFCRGCSYNVPGLQNMFSAVTEFSYLNTRFFEMAR